MTISYSRGKKQRNDIPILLYDILFRILILLPAEFLYYRGKYVCKAWAKIIRDPSFIKEHLLRSKSGLFIQKFGKPYHADFLEFKGGEFNVTPLNCYFPGNMVSTCGGLSLFCGSHPHCYLFVGNPVTLQYQCLPFPIAENELFPACRIIFVPRTGQYRVVCHCLSLTATHRWIVLTLGHKLLWRKLETYLTGINLDYVERTSVTIDGVLYWSHRNSGIHAIDLYDEATHWIQVPNEFVETSSSLLQLGKSLSCVVNHQGEVQVSIMKDLYHSEWAKLYKIVEAIDQHKFLCPTFIPVCWLEDGKILMFVVRRSTDWKEKLVVAYNGEKGETKTFNDVNAHVVEIHTQSLVSW